MEHINIVKTVTLKESIVCICNTSEVFILKHVLKTVFDQENKLYTKAYGKAP